MTYWRFDPSRLRAARISRGWSLAELARRADLKPPALSAMETHHHPCRERSAHAVAEALGVALSEVAEPYARRSRRTPRQLPVEVFPTAADFKQLELCCREVATVMFRVSERTDLADERDAVVMTDVAALVRAFADVRESGRPMELVGFQSLLEYHAAQAHYAITVLTSEHRAECVRALESMNVDVGQLSHPAGVRAAAIAVADWIRLE
jgi:transcriptional regulator with XRE-family HTH domain